MINLEETVIRKLKTSQHIVGTVESCTGGLIAHLLTNVSGASEVFWGSLVTYDNSAKEELGVSSQSILDHGAVSETIAKEMAEKGLNKIEINPFRSKSFSLIKPRGIVCIATTGIAGPSGGTLDKPVGTCFIGLAISGRKTRVEEFHPVGTLDRIQNKLYFAQRALELIRGSF